MIRNHNANRHPQNRPAPFVIFWGIGFCLGTAACNHGEPSPVDVARAIVTAINDGNAAEVYSYLDERSQKHLAQMANSANALSINCQHFQAKDLLVTGQIPPRYELRTIELVSVTPLEARVRLIGPHNEPSEFLTLIKQSGKWRIKLI